MSLGLERLSHSLALPALLRKLGTDRHCLEKGPAELLPSPSCPPQVWSMALGSSLPASPAACRQRAREAPEGGGRGCAVPGTLLLLLAYLTYLALGTVVFWLLESPVAHDSSRRFWRDKWTLLQNFTCLDGPALDSLIRVRGGLGARGAGGRGWRRGAQGARAGGERASVAPVRATPGAVLQKKVEGIDAGTSGGARCQVGTKELGRTAKERVRLPRAECAARPGGVRG